MRHRLMILALAAVTAGCTSGQAPSPLERAGPDAVAGLAYAQQNCSGCHAIGAHGHGPNSASRPFREIATRYTDVELSERLADLQTGHYRMPPLAVSEAELKNLIAYLHTLREGTR
jgi:cytochrome c